jgi:hypothetical protein
MERIDAPIGGTGVHRIEDDTAAALVRMVRDFARDVVAPRVQNYDQEESIPRDILWRR